MKLIVGLGNPGDNYQFTRHNFGWLVLNYLAGSEKWQQIKPTKAQYLRLLMNDQEVELLKPLTFINESGIAVAVAASKHQIPPHDIIIVHDDLALPFGTIRLGIFKSTAGHNGLKSIVQHLKSTDFVRCRLGIGNDYSDRADTARFVLNKFSSLEKKHLEQLIKIAAESITHYLSHDLQSATNQYNKNFLA